jgi:hypothetical protein
VLLGEVYKFYTGCLSVLSENLFPEVFIKPQPGNLAMTETLDFELTRLNQISYPILVGILSLHPTFVTMLKEQTINVLIPFSIASWI